jgi:two-component system response regulator
MTRETNVLLVEDTEDHAILIRRALEGGNLRLRIFWVTDGKAALDYLYNEGNFTDSVANPRPDIILLDLRLPKIHGLKVLELIKKDQALKTIPVAVLTASDEVKDLIGSYHLGAETFVTKPIAFLNKGEFSGLVLDVVVSLTGT